MKINGKKKYKTTGGTEVKSVKDKETISSLDKVRVIRLPWIQKLRNVYIIYNCLEILYNVVVVVSEWLSGMTKNHGLRRAGSNLPTTLFKR